MLFLCNFKSNLQVVKFKEQLKIIEIISVHENINVHSFVNETDVEKQRSINFKQKQDFVLCLGASLNIPINNKERNDT